MFDKKELVAIGVSSIFLGFALSFYYFLADISGATLGVSYLQIFLTMFLFIFLIILINSLAKKIAAYYFDSNLRVRFWGIKRFGYRPDAYFRAPFSAGIMIPLITSFVTLGYFVWLSPLVFDSESKTSRVSKKHGLYSHYYMNESHMGVIAAFGILVNVFFAYIAYLIGFSEFSRLSLYFAMFNMIPFSDLDGAKIFFGNMVLWLVMLGVAMIGVLIGVLIL